MEAIKEQRTEVLKLQVTAAHLLQNLGTDLYKSPIFCLMELVRNSMAASMGKEKWEPEKVAIEILLSDNHPLIKSGRALVVLDHGRGFKAEDIERFCLLGASEARVKARSDNDLGLSQKGIGRFAALALNKTTFEVDNKEAGFYIFTRTQPFGDVTMVEVFPKFLENGRGGFPKRTISEYDEIMHDISGTRGSFSAIVIPNPIFLQSEEIRDGLRWSLPRKRNKTISVRVDGKAVIVPTLADKLIINQAGIEGYFDINANTDDPHGGVYFVDAYTGLRVCSASSIGHKYVPAPFWLPNLSGDIFIPGLLRHQDTSRSSLSPNYLKSKEWQKFCNLLELHFKRPVEALLGVESSFGSNQVTKLVEELIESASAAFGAPEGSEVNTGNRWKVESNNNKREVRISEPREKTEETEVKDKTTGNSAKEKQTRQQIQTRHIKIGNTSFTLHPKQLPKNILFDPHPFFGSVYGKNIIYMNMPDTYGALSTNASIRRWQVYYELAGAVAQTEFGRDPSKMREKQTEYANKMLKK